MQMKIYRPLSPFRVAEIQKLRVYLVGKHVRTQTLYIADGTVPCYNSMRIL